MIETSSIPKKKSLQNCEVLWSDFSEKSERQARRVDYRVLSAHRLDYSDY